MTNCLSNQKSVLSDFLPNGSLRGELRREARRPASVSIAKTVAQGGTAAVVFALGAISSLCSFLIVVIAAA